MSDQKNVGKRPTTTARAEAIEDQLAEVRGGLRPSHAEADSTFKADLTVTHLRPSHVEGDSI